MGLDIYIQKKVRRSKELAYFRKVKFLIPFIEDYYNIAELENCEEIELDKYCIEELIIRCKQVLEDHSKAEELLPVKGGFFFGSTEYDQGYFEDVQLVKDTCLNLLEEFLSLEDGEYITFSIWY